MATLREELIRRILQLDQDRLPRARELLLSLEAGDASPLSHPLECGDASPLFLQPARHLGVR